VDQWIGNLFYRGVSTTEINAMTYHEMRYWNGWHKVMEDADRKSIEKLKGGKR
jgi:SHS2 domain-containing protein